ncbi:MAG: DNA repair protein RecN [Bacteroidales bacterium]|nr:DNA repair protein RecN [Bacteroidales bacterium]
MLQALQIENYALIRSLSITFDQGFTVITGETGAGKSILMGALSLILGNRADTDILYDKERKCIVEGTFNISTLSLQSFFEENDLDYQDTTIIRREINEKGKSRAFINDTPVTLNTLKNLASILIDIHSQHQNLLINDSGFRLNIIDQYAQNQETRAAYRESLTQWRRTEEKYNQLKQQCADAALQQEFHNFTVKELEQAHLQPEEQTQTEQNIELLSHAEEIKEHLYRAAQQLSEQDGETILQQLKSVESECSALTHLGNDYQEIANRLHNAIIEIQDLSYEISRKEAEVEVNPQELDRLNERIDLIYTLEKKYQVENIQGLLDLKAQLEETLLHYTDNQEALDQAESDRARLEKQTIQLAQKLTKSRQAVLSKLEKSMMQRLSLLGMSNCQFSIKLETTDAVHDNGMDQAIFLFSANKGVAPADVSKIASGGEMSRLMLALKSIITDSVLLPTVIFDEIDTGISGETANKVAKVMSLLAEGHQVIAITHLPQIAATGKQHYLVFKETSQGQTTTNLKMLTNSEREQAIATMLSGAHVTESAIATARELIQSKTQS